MSFGRSNQQWATFSRVWYILNADRQPAGGVGDLVSHYLQGLHKPIYHGRSDCGDHVVVVNARKIAYSGNKWEEKVFTAHTGRKKGRIRMQAFEVHQRDPTWNVPDEIMQNVTHVLVGPRRVPKKLSDYTQEEIDSFPSLFLRDEMFLKS